MCVKFHADYDPGKNVVVTCRQKTSVGAEGYFWNENTAAWQSSEPSEADKRIALVEAESDGVYTGAKVLGTFTGLVTVRYFDTAIANPLASDVVEIYNGAEVTDKDKRVYDLYEWWKDGGERTTSLETAEAGGAELNISPDIVSSGRTWIVPADSIDAVNKVVVVAGSVCTFAIDFRRAVNPATGLLSAVSAVEDDGDITFTDLQVQQERMQLHFTNSTTLVAGEYTITAKVDTTDGQTIGAKCKLRVR